MELVYEIHTSELLLFCFGNINCLFHESIGFVGPERSGFSIRAAQELPDLVNSTLFIQIWLAISVG